MLTITLVILIPFIATIFVPLIHKMLNRIHIGWIVLVVPAVLFIALLRLIPFVAEGGVKEHTFEWIPSYNINFTTYLDGLSMIFGLLITGIGSLVILYSIYYLSEKESLRHFYIYLLMFMGSMLGVVFSDNILVIYVFWEMTSIASFLLIAFWYHRKQSRYGAQKSLLITVLGGFAMFISFIMLYHMTGTFSVHEIMSYGSTISEHSLFIPAMLLLLLGAFTKSAQFPFYIWLPDAMEAPTPVSAYLHSATMVKAGIYIVARFTPIFGGGEIWFWFVGGIGIITMAWGSLFAVRQTDLKALLAYSTVSQLGMIMAMLGFGSIAYHLGYSTESVIYTQAVFAALFHLVNHATFKCALFMIVGIIDLRLGTRDIRRLGGLMSIMPVSFTVAMIGSFSMAGLPPFNGFLSKEMFFTSLLNIAELDIFSLDTWGTLIPVVAWSASVFTFVYCLIIVFKTFFGKYKGETYDRKLFDAPAGMLISPIILGCLIIFTFFFPNMLGYNLIFPAIVDVFPSFNLEPTAFSILAWHGWNTELWMTIGIVLLGSVLYLTFRHWKVIYRLFPEHLSFDTLYNHTLFGLEKGSAWFTRKYMTGYLRDYLVYIYLFIVIVTGGILFYVGAFTWNVEGDSPVTTYEWIFVIVIAIAAFAILFAKSRITAILLNSVIGFSVAFFFVLFRAPDLALTQTIIETVTTVLFMLCFYFLPEWK
ncbi:MAG TPA: Na+/H+ antiporter subunit A, partial [Bacillota bacterium]|nr:Na+/H+ antiporter subunit A [Bacillota bacterium]